MAGSIPCYEFEPAAGDRDEVQAWSGVAGGLSCLPHREVVRLPCILPC